MGGVHSGRAGYGDQSQCEQHLARADGGRRGDSIDAEREGFLAGVVAGGKDDCVYFVAEWRFTSVFAFDGWGRSSPIDKTLDGRGFGNLVAGREDNCVYIGRLSGM